MIRHRRARLALVLVSSSLVLLAGASCGGKGEPVARNDAPAGARPDNLGSPGLRSLAPVGAPLWTVSYDPAPDALWPALARIDAAGNVWLLAQRKLDCRDCPTASEVFAFDPAGAGPWWLASPDGNENHPTRSLEVSTAAYAVETAFQSLDQISLQRAARTSGSAFRYVYPGRSVGPLDVCADGTTFATFGGCGATLVVLDGTGQVLSQVGLSQICTQEVRCVDDADGNARIAGTTSSGNATATQVRRGGTIDWTWTSGTPVQAPVRIRTDGNGDTFLSTTNQVFALDARGIQQWAWETNAELTDIAVSDVVAVSGKVRRPGRYHPLVGTDFYVALLDLSGNVLWAREDATFSGLHDAIAWRVALDAADDAFVCGYGAHGVAMALYGAGGTKWTFDARYLMAGIMDAAVSTDGIARCVGPIANGVGVVAFRAP